MTTGWGMSPLPKETCGVVSTPTFSVLTVNQLISLMICYVSY